MLKQQEFENRLKWLVNLRWIGIAGVLAGVHIVRAVEILSFPLLPVYAILGFASLYNLFFWWKLRTPREEYRRLAFSQIVLDQFTLSLAMYFSGGCDSPLIYFFIFHVVISGLLLSFRDTMVVASLAVLFPGSVMGMKFFGVLPHFGIFKEEPMLFKNLTIMASYAAAYLSTLFVTAYFVAYLNKKQLENRDELARNNVKLSTLLEASRLTSFTLELEHILAESLKVVLHITKLKVGLVLLINQEKSRRCYEFFDCKALDCPAYKADVNCWMLSGTKFHGTAGPDEGQAPLAMCHRHAEGAAGNPPGPLASKVKACTSCEYFTSMILMPRMAKGFEDCARAEETVKLDNETIKRALLTGCTIVETGARPDAPAVCDMVTEIAMPLQVRQQLVGVLYFASDEAIDYSEDNRNFFQLLAEVISAGVMSGRMYEDIESSYLQTVTALANAIEAKDPYTRGHTERVADVCVKIGEAVLLSPRELERLRFAAILHDVGKIAINKEILWKEDGLIGDEAVSIQTHPDKGVQILEPIIFLRPLLSTIRHHHERYDGTGYPSKLTGRDIPFQARILAIADAWDSMLSDRPYRRAMSVEAAIKELRDNAGTQFDPQLVEIYLKTLE